VLFGTVVPVQARPRYGGTLHIEVAAAVQALDPAQPSSSAAARAIQALVYEPLVRMDDTANVEGVLAQAWLHDASAREWRFTLRTGVKFQDGSPLTAAAVAQSLAATESTWHVTVEGEQVVIALPAPAPNLLGELTLPRHAIRLTSAGNAPIGTGPFAVRDFQPGGHVVLLANGSYWGGRPFIDEVDVRLGRNAGDQWVDFQLGRADVVELPPERAGELSPATGTSVSSAATELVALVFRPESVEANDERVRQAIALSVDRAAINNFLLQRSGTISATLLPNWMTGYGFLFDTGRDLNRARGLVEQLASRPVVSIGFDQSDSLTSIIAQRIALDAAQSGCSVRAGPTSAGRYDAEVVRIPIESSDPGTALTALARTLQLNGAAATAVTADQTAPGDYGRLYTLEHGLLAGSRIVPLVHVPEAYALSRRVNDWREPALGGWPIANAWLAPGKNR
jgi:peptide/nickel transport system substrate-binding protein